MLDFTSIWPNLKTCLSYFSMTKTITKNTTKNTVKKVRMTFTLPQETANEIKNLIKDANYSQYVSNLIDKDLANKKSDITFKQIYQKMKQRKGGIIIDNKDELEKLYAEMGLR